MGNLTVNEADASRPPSPPETGANTPVLRIAPCPPRLAPILPPPNYGNVEESCIYRSAFPQDRNMSFLKLLDIKLVLCLVDTEATQPYRDWMKTSEIALSRIDIATNKDGQVNTTLDSLCEAILLLMDPSNYPIHIHCNQGKHRTGCVVACYRKIKREPIEEIIAEYEAYAGAKARSGDIDLIRAFDPQCVFDYAQTHGYFADRYFMRKIDSTVCDIDSLVTALASYDSDADMSMDDMGSWDMSITSGSSVTSDEGLEMARSPPLVDGFPMLQRQQPPAPSTILLDPKNISLTGSAIDDADDDRMDDISTDAMVHSPDSITTITELGDEDLGSSSDSNLPIFA